MGRSPVKVLLVDDEEDFVEMLSLRLEAVGETVLPAYSGEACLKILEQDPVDVVVLDVKMPGMDGIETLREIRKRFPDLPVIMMTGHGTVEAAREGKALGAFDYMLKPANFEELREKLEKARKRKTSGEA